MKTVKATLRAALLALTLLLTLIACAEKTPDLTALYICPPSADLDAEELYAIPVALPKELLRAYVDEYGDPSGIGLFPNGFTLRVTATLEMYEEFQCRPLWNAPVLVVTELIPAEAVEKV